VDDFVRVRDPKIMLAPGPTTAAAAFGILARPHVTDIDFRLPGFGFLSHFLTPPRFSLISLSDALLIAPACYVISTRANA